MYWVSWRDDAMASPGAKLAMSSSATARARSATAGIARAQRQQQPLSGDLSQRHRLDRRHHLVLEPGPQIRDARRFAVDAQATRRERPRRRQRDRLQLGGARRARSRRADRDRRPAGQRAAHLLRFRAQLGGLARSAKPVVPALEAPPRRARPRRPAGARRSPASAGGEHELERVADPRLRRRRRRAPRRPRPPARVPANS